MADRMESASGGARPGRTTTTEPEAPTVSTITTAAVHRAREHPDRFHSLRLNAVGIARRARCSADRLGHHQGPAQAHPAGHLARRTPLRAARSRWRAGAVILRPSGLEREPVGQSQEPDNREHLRSS